MVCYENSSLLLWGVWKQVMAVGFSPTLQLS